MNEKRPTTKELTNEAGVTWGTLNGYVKRGVLKPPEIVHYGAKCGRGSRALWPPGSIDRLLEIQRYRKLGLTLNEIGEILKGEIRDA